MLPVFSSSCGSNMVKYVSELKFLDVVLNVILDLWLFPHPSNKFGILRKALSLSNDPVLMIKCILEILTSCALVLSLVPVSRQLLISNYSRR